MRDLFWLTDKQMQRIEPYFSLSHGVPRVDDGVSEEEFVAMREQRDAGLSVPKLLLPSIQVNIRAGHFHEAETNGVSYLRIPVKWKTE